MVMIGVGGFQYNSKMLELITNTIKNNRISQGPLVAKFEKQFAGEHSCEYGLFINSGTSALHVALQALKILYNWSDDCEVIIPGVTFVATANIIIHNNLQPVIVDVSLDDYGIDIEKFKAAITPKTVAVIPVHLFGQPCKIDEIVSICKECNIKIIEDSCETMYATCSGKSVGSFGDIGCFSTYVAHLLTTGVGGFCTTNDKELYNLCKSLANHGRNISYITIDDKCDISKRFEFNHVGHSFRATELEAAIGLGQIDDMHSQIQRRRDIAARYTKELASLPLVLPSIKTNCEHSFMMYPILYNKRSELSQYLEDFGIETRPFVSITNQPCYNIVEEDFPNSMRCNNEGLYIGCHPFMTDEEIDEVIYRIHDFFHGGIL